MRHSPAIFVSVFVITAMCGQFAIYAEEVSPLTSLSTAEKSYYEKVFDYSMEVVKPGEKYDWASYSGKGSISIEAPFVSKSGATCRNFSESFNVLGQDGIDKGVGCKRRGKEGWCKLDLSKAQTCSFEDTPMFITPNVVAPSYNSHDNVNVDAPDIDTNVNTNVNTNVDTGNMPKNNITSKSYADTVTGSAGKAAGTAASNGLSWFSSTFLR